MSLRKTLLLTACVIGTSSLQAQDFRADSAARTASQLTRTQAATETSSVVSAEAEADLGEQVPVGEDSRGIGLYGLGNASLFYTSNPSLSSGGGRGDLLFVAQGGGGLYRHLTGGLYLDGHVSQSFFQYAQFSSLNFLYFNAGGGLDYVFEQLGRLTASVRYEYQRYLDAENLDEFYVNNALTVGLSKEFHLNDIMALQAGVQAELSLTAIPSSARRNEYDFWLGWRWRIAQPLELQTYYILSLFHYPNDERFDVTNNVGAALNLFLTRWARLTASVNFGANSSTDSFFDYTVVNVGGSLGLDIRF